MEASDINSILQKIFGTIYVKYTKNKIVEPPQRYNQKSFRSLPFKILIALSRINSAKINPELAITMEKKSGIKFLNASIPQKIDRNPVPIAHILILLALFG